MKRIIGSVGLFVGVVAICSTVWAQDAAPQPAAAGQGGEHVTQGGAPGGGQGGGDRGQGRGNFSPEQFRQRMMDHMKEQLKATDEEWTVIKPLLDKVMQAREAGMRGRFRGMMGGRRGPDNQQQPNTPAQPGQAETDALRAALDDANAPADTIKTKLAAVRDAHAKSEEELKKAREALRGVLTQRQEAELVLMGMMD